MSGLTFDSPVETFERSLGGWTSSPGAQLVEHLGGTFGRRAVDLSAGRGSAKLLPRT